MSAPKVITIDGPSAAGKGSVSLLVANLMGWHILPSGLLYRHLALIAREKKKIERPKLEQIEDILRLIPSVNPEFHTTKNDVFSLRALAGKKDITDELMSEDIGELAGQISAFAKIREALKKKQYAFRRLPGLVAEGRDMGTTIFPDAALKIFLTANLDVRARRRLKQLRTLGDASVTIKEVLNMMRLRDERDIHRKSSPLKKSQESIILDTSQTSAEQIAQQIVQVAESRNLK